MAFPLTVEGRVRLGSAADAEVVAYRLWRALRREGVAEVGVRAGLVTFGADLGHQLIRSNALSPFDAGQVRLEAKGGELQAVYSVSLRRMAALAAGLAAAMGLLVGLTRDLAAAFPVWVLVFALLLGFVHIGAAVRFPRWLKRAALSDEG